MKKRLLLFLPLIIFCFSSIVSQIDSTQYLLKQFEDATVYFKDGGQSSEKINYNLIANSFFFIDKTDGSIKQISSTQDIRLIRIGNRSFIFNNEDAVEVIPINPLIYVQYKADVREQGKKAAFGTTSETTAIRTYGATYNRGRRIEFDPNTVIAGKRYNIYWVEKKGKKKKFITFKQFLKIYPNHKIVLEQYIKDNDIRFNDVEQIKNLCLYAESL